MSTRARRATVATLIAFVLLAIAMIYTPPTPQRGGLFTSPIEPAYQVRLVYIARNAPTAPAHSAKKGTWRPDCSISQGLAWSFVGDACPGIEQVPYLTHPAHLEIFEPQSSQSSQFALFFNEPDLYPAPWDDMAQLVKTQAVLEARWPTRQWVGPCVSQIGGASWLAEYAETYRSITGHALDVAALCVHCYGTCDDCKNVTENVTSLAASFGIGVWVTEFGYPQGTEAEAIAEAGAFAAWLDGNPHIERWAYWPGTDSGPEEFDWDFWKPVIRDGQLTPIGRAFVYDWP